MSDLVAGQWAPHPCVCECGIRIYILCVYTPSPKRGTRVDDNKSNHTQRYGYTQRVFDIALGLRFLKSSISFLSLFSRILTHSSLRIINKFTLCICNHYTIMNFILNIFKIYATIFVSILFFKEIINVNLCFQNNEFICLFLFFFWIRKEKKWNY